LVDSRGWAMAIEWGQEEEKLVVKEGKGYGGLSIIQNASVK